MATLADFTEERLVAVMGDIVGSENARSPAELHDALNRAVDTANADWSMVSPLTITLGDEFQGLVDRMTDALELVRTMRLNLLAEGWRCRFVIGRVWIASPINPNRAWNMLGRGLAQTRDKLNQKTAGAAYRFELGRDEKTIEALMDAVGRSLTLVEDGWTDRQREVVDRLVQPEATILEAQNDLNAAPRTLYKIRQAANFEFYRTQWDALHSAAADLDRRQVPE